MNRIVFISDLFWFDGSVGGAELCDGAIIEELLYKKYSNFRDWMVCCAPSHLVTPDFLEKNKDSVFFVSNFMRLSEESKRFFHENNLYYTIIEHDHKYVRTNNPSMYPENLCREDHLQNEDFYKKATFVMCQSTLHSEILYKNLLLKNIVNLKGNLWLDLHIEQARKLYKDTETLREEKNPTFWGVLMSDNPNKGTPQAIKYCQDKDLPFDLIRPATWKHFLMSMTGFAGIVFLPTWVESFNRVLVEARLLGLKVKTNNRIGCESDGWLKYKGDEMFEKIIAVKKDILSLYDKVIHRDTESIQVYQSASKLPRVSIMTTFAEAEEYIDGFMQHVCTQTIFDEIDLLIYDAGSTGKEREVIERYCKKYDNIHYIRDEEKIGSSEAFNRMIQKSPNDFMGMISIDDRPVADYAEVLRKHLLFSKTDLVYGDCLVSEQKNGLFLEVNTKSKHLPYKIYEHSESDFSPHNMIKSLPGPMPMFRKSMIESHGGFSTSLKHANDWELWLRCVRGGSIFQKVHVPVGIYYYNPDGVTTSHKTFESKLTEENQIFNEYRDVLGEKNYHMYKNHFSQFSNKEQTNV